MVGIHLKIVMIKMIKRNLMSTKKSTNRKIKMKRKSNLDEKQEIVQRN